MDPDLRDLLAAWLGGEGEAARRDELVARVRQDEGFRRAFVDEIRMLGMLKTVQSPESRWLRLEDELGWPHRRIASVLGGVARLRQREFEGRRPYRFLDERHAASGRWEIWMDSRQARAIVGARRAEALD